jgi:predicted Zn-dependent protease with MMP-like domain
VDAIVDIAPIVSEERFEEITAEVLDWLPDWIRVYMDNVDVLIAADPPADQPNLLGLYEGVPLTRRGLGYAGMLPDRITLYRSAILRGVKEEFEVRRRVRQIVAHEIAHHFGISDDRLREIDRY